MEDEFTEKGDKNKVPQQEKKLLYERVEELKRSNAFLKAENHMFERFISRLDPGDLVPQPAAEGLGGLGASQLEVGGRGRRQRTQSNTPDCPQQLTLGQKCYVAQRQVEQTQEDLEKHKHSSERIQENYKAILEEADIRLAEIRKAKYEFERDVAEPLKEKKGEIMGAEKVLRYIEDKIKRKDTQVEKLQLKNQALKAQARKLQRQLRQQQQEETLNEADFQQFKIENNQYQEQIDEHNRDLLRLKQLAGDTQQVLNTYKRKLQNVICRSEELSSDITKRKEMLVKIEEETQQVEKERSKEEAVNQTLRSQLAEYSVPDVFEYIQVNSKHNKLQRDFRAWERKVEIAKMGLKTHTNAWNKQRDALAAAHSPEAGGSSGTCPPLVKLPNINLVKPKTTSRRPSK